MLPRDYAEENCSMARTLEVVGDRWTLLIVREALAGVTRFDDFLQRLGRGQECARGPTGAAGGRENP